MTTIEKMQRTKKGMSVIGFLLMLVAVGFIALIAVRVIPVYLESFKAVQIMKRIQGDRDLVKGGIPAIRKTISRRMNIEQLSVVTMKDVKISKTKDGFLIEMEYEDRFPLLGNLDGVASFKWKAELKR